LPGEHHPDRIVRLPRAGAKVGRAAHLDGQSH
jgi:hypothetical protein